MRSSSLIAALLTSSISYAGVTSPKAFLGHEVCADYKLAHYAQLTGYWQRLAKESDRIRIVEIGKTEFGRPQYMAIISDPANLKSLERHRAMSERFALARFEDESEAAREARTAKPVVWIDGGLHANEVLGAQQLIETAYRLVSREDEETRRIRRDVVTLLVHANPDGMDLVTHWYMRREKPEERSLAGLPVLYEKYAGHDNNRDSYAGNLAETRNMNRVLYREWFPQILYNHHQSAPSGTIMFVPPFRSPFNHNVDAIVENGTDLVGTVIQSRLIGEGKGGTVSREAANFSSWWNGGVRTTAYFHNIIGILTETWGSPNPTPVPFRKERQVPIADLPLPVEPRLWHLRDSLEYELSANYAILDHASRYREPLLLATYRAASNQIERGSRDSWSRYPSRVAQYGEDAIKRPELRDARAYVIPAESPDPGAVALFIARLQGTGVEVGQAVLDGSGYKKGDLVVRTDQPFRPHILDMFEPQDHPNDFRYPGGPPIPPYDAAGYTLAFQMGVPFTRILDGKDVPLVKTLKRPPVLSTGKLLPKERLLAGPGDTRGYALAALTINAGGNVLRRDDGTFVIPLLTGDDPKADYPGVKSVRLPKIALLDVYGGSMASGWTRWLLDEFKLGYTVVTPPEIEAGALKGFDALMIPSGIATSRSPEAKPFPYAGELGVTAEIARTWGPYSADRTGAAIRRWAEGGGHIIAWGEGADALAKTLDLPVKSAMTGVKRDDFYIPGSVLRVALKPSVLTRGMGEGLHVIVDDSPVFAVEDAAKSSVVAAWEEAKPLRSGWAWGQEKLKGNAAMVDLPVGKGRAFLSGPELNYRGQSYASFRLLLAALFRSTESEEGTR